MEAELFRMARPTKKSLAFTVVEKVEQMSRSTFDVVDDMQYMTPVERWPRTVKISGVVSRRLVWNIWDKTSQRSLKWAGLSVGCSYRRLHIKIYRELTCLACRDVLIRHIAYFFFEWTLCWTQTAVRHLSLQLDLCVICSRADWLQRNVAAVNIHLVHQQKRNRKSD